MAYVMNLNKILCWLALGSTGVIAIIFSLDLALGIFFNRFSITTDICVILACGLLIWQGVEALLEQ